MQARHIMNGLFAALLLAADTGLARAQETQPVELTPYHVPVFSNEYVTVLNVHIPPGRESGFHRHALDTVGVLLGDTELQRTLPDGSQTIAPARTPGTVSFSAYGTTPIVHAVTNLGATPFHNIVIELLNSEALGLSPGSRDHNAAYRQVLVNDRVEIWHLRLAPGASAPAITQSGPGLRIAITGGEFAELIDGRPVRGIAPRQGDFYWLDAGTMRTLTNLGAAALELIEIELR